MMSVYISDEDMQSLNRLMGLALLEPSISDLLLIYRDERLMKEFGISYPVRHWLKQVRATTLVEMAQAIVRQREQNIYYVDTTSTTYTG